MSQVILLVDDEENILSALYRLLRQDGYEILRAVGGAAALELLKSHKPGVIISDQRMPGMTGVQFLSQAKTICPDSVRLVLSGYTDLKTVTDAINEGSIYKFLTKPWDDDFLRATVADAFRFHDILLQNKILQQDLLAANEQLSRQAELEIALSHEQTKVSLEALETAQEVLDIIPVAVIGVSMEGDIILANQAAENLLGGISLFGGNIHHVLPGILDNPDAIALPGVRPYLINETQTTLNILPLSPMHKGLRGLVLVFTPMNANI
ncbi:ATP-binding response regulator [Leeia oryzae]|uniref:ATP-binding response regulator n=1 Tax=Leeia oryzae TaxID=356662 RepID=UPI00036086A4|nr:response regulator [Leeia oryzae]